MCDTTPPRLTRGIMNQIETELFYDFFKNVHVQLARTTVRPSYLEFEASKLVRPPYPNYLTLRATILSYVQKNCPAAKHREEAQKYTEAINFALSAYSSHTVQSHGQPRRADLPPPVSSKEKWYTDKHPVLPPPSVLYLLCIGRIDCLTAQEADIHNSDNILNILNAMRVAIAMNSVEAMEAIRPFYQSTHNKDKTVLHLCCEIGSEKCFLHLIQQTPQDVTRPDANGHLPLDLCLLNCKPIHPYNMILPNVADCVSGVGRGERSGADERVLPDYENIAVHMLDNHSTDIWASTLISDLSCVSRICGTIDCIRVWETLMRVLIDSWDQASELGSDRCPLHVYYIAHHLIESLRSTHNRLWATTQSRVLTIVNQDGPEVLDRLFGLCEKFVTKCVCPAIHYGLSRSDLAVHSCHCYCAGPGQEPARSFPVTSGPLAPVDCSLCEICVLMSICCCTCEDMDRSAYWRIQSTMRTGTPSREDEFKSMYGKLMSVTRRLFLCCYSAVHAADRALRTSLAPDIVRLMRDMARRFCDLAHPTQDRPMQTRACVLLAKLLTHTDFDVNYELGDPDAVVWPGTHMRRPIIKPLAEPSSLARLAGTAALQSLAIGSCPFSDVWLERGVPSILIRELLVEETVAVKDCSCVA